MPNSAATQANGKTLTGIQILADAYSLQHKHTDRIWYALGTLSLVVIGVDTQPPHDGTVSGTITVLGFEIPNAIAKVAAPETVEVVSALGQSSSRPEA